MGTYPTNSDGYPTNPDGYPNILKRSPDKCGRLPDKLGRCPSKTEKPPKSRLAQYTQRRRIEGVYKEPTGRSLKTYSNEHLPCGR